jgi:hypothetical protein
MKMGHDEKDDLYWLSISIFFADPFSFKTP